MKKPGLCASMCLVALALGTPVWATPNPLTEVRFLQAMKQGKTAYTRGDFAAAERDYQQALRQRPESVEALNNLGDAQYRAARFGEAQKSYEQSGKEGSGSRSAYQDGNALYRQNKLPEARKAYEDALRLNQNDDDARYNLQLVLDKLKKHSQEKKDKKDQQDQKTQPKDDSKGKPDQKDGSKGKPDQKSGSHAESKGKPDPKTSNRQNPTGAPKVADQKPADAGKPSPAQANARPTTPSAAKRDDSDRILQYYRNQERQARRQPVSAPQQPQAGQETW